MIKSAITICLVKEARQGPFVFHEPLAVAIPKIAALGFDAVEIFPPHADAVDSAELRKLLNGHALKLAAMGTGAGFLIHKVTLADPDAAVRKRAVQFITRIIEKAAEFSAPAIVGSIQGRHADGRRDDALAMLADALAELAAHAKPFHVPLLYEPLNRYETNLFVRQAEAADWIRQNRIDNLKVLSDLFHMNIEEADIAQALRSVGDLLGHVHFVDSNRKAAGMGHMDYPPIVQALRAIGYRGYCSAECLPLPDTDSAARQVIAMHKQLFAK